MMDKIKKWRKRYDTPIKLPHVHGERFSTLRHGLVWLDPTGRNLGWMMRSYLRAIVRLVIDVVRGTRIAYKNFYRIARMMENAQMNVLMRKLSKMEDFDDPEDANRAIKHLIKSKHEQWEDERRLK